jgi:hypothetical protein
MKPIFHWRINTLHKIQVQKPGNFGKSHRAAPAFVLRGKAIHLLYDDGDGGNSEVREGDTPPSTWVSFVRGRKGIPPEIGFELQTTGGWIMIPSCPSHLWPS